MKILFSGHHNPHFPTITEYIESAIQALGHELYIFEDSKHRIPGRIRRFSSLLQKVNLNYINKQLISLAAAVHPDITIISGGERITLETVQKLKNYCANIVLWTIDAPINFARLIQTAPSYNYIFCQGTEAIEIFERVSIKGAKWLPMACDPYYHHPVECTSADREKFGSAIVFVGSYYPDRAVLFEKLANLDLAIWGPGWDRLPPSSPLRRKIRGRHTIPDEWLKIYSASKIVLATHYQDPQKRFPVYQASPRIFEALACGAFVICDNQRDVFSLFEDRKHLVCFYDEADLIEKIKYYLDHLEERNVISAQGRQEAIAKHTYVHRIRKLLSIIGDHS